MILGLIFLFGNTLFWQSCLNSNAFGQFSFRFYSDITAHRGDTQNAPENTLASIRSAIALGADYAEIDVQLTKDGEFILFHDTNFQRIAGVPFKPADCNLEEIKKLDIGFYFGSDFSKEQIPTLREILKEAKGHIVLNIEVKVNRDRDLMVQKLLADLQAEKAEDFVVISCADYDFLQRVKQAAPQIPTGYIMAMAMGDFVSLSAADFFSVEYSFVSADLLQKAHSLGKEVHVWTINQKRDMEALWYMGVDNIITDQTQLALQWRAEMNEKKLWSGLWE